MTRNAETEITAAGSETRTFVIPTDEELVMTEDTFAIMNGDYDVHTNFSYSFQDPGYRHKDRDKKFEEEIRDRPQLAEIRAEPGNR